VGHCRWPPPGQRARTDPATCSGGRYTPSSWRQRDEVVAGLQVFSRSTAVRRKVFGYRLTRHVPTGKAFPCPVCLRACLNLRGRPLMRSVSCGRATSPSRENDVRRARPTRFVRPEQDRRGSPAARPRAPHPSPLREAAPHRRQRASPDRAGSVHRGTRSLRVTATDSTRPAPSPINAVSCPA
jgi:hypothetical protein